MQTKMTLMCTILNRSMDWWNFDLNRHPFLRNLHIKGSYILPNFEKQDSVLTFSQNADDLQAPRPLKRPAIPFV